MNLQQKLSSEAKWVLDDIPIKKLRGVIAEWKDETAFITFYFETEPSEDDLEEASVYCGEIIARFPSGLLNEEYLTVEISTPLPQSTFWVYKKE
jgi:hypothetical protein